LKVREDVDAATKQGKADSELGLEELAADIYSENLEGTIRGLSAAEQIKHINVGPRVNYK